MDPAEDACITCSLQVCNLAFKRLLEVLLRDQQIKRVGHNVSDETALKDSKR
jgi:hypothetical protein